MSKTLYQSELVKLGEVRAEIKSEPTPSKYAGKPPFVAMVVNGEERFYSCENEGIAETLKGRKGQVVRLLATGGREDAQIHIEVALDGDEHGVEQVETSGGGSTYQKAKPAKDSSHAPSYHPGIQNQEGDQTTRRSNEHTLRAESAKMTFELAWIKSGEVNLMPDKDAEDMSTYEYYDLRLRVAQFIAINSK